MYNTLESINSLAKIREDYEVADSICLLGDYLRETISEKKKFVSLEEELENIRKYIKIQQISYADRVKMEIFSDEMLSEALVPKLILQPLIENAIVHGIEPKLGKGLIRVEARCVKKTMEIAIWDNGVGINPKQIKDGRFVENMSKGVGENENHTKVGITAVHKRIQILYGETYGIFVTGSRGNGTCVVIRLPIIFEGEEE